MSTATATRPTKDAKRRIWGDPDLHYVLPEGTEAPEPIQKAGAKARSAVNAFEAAKAELDDARQTHEAAPAADRATAASAIAEGNDIPEPTEPAIRAEVGKAARKVEAMKRFANAALNVQADAMVDHWDEWVAAEETAAQADAEKQRKLIDSLREAHLRRRRRVIVRDAMSQFGGAPQHFLITQPDLSRDAEKQGARLERARTELAARKGSGRNQVERDFEHLVAALLEVIEKETV